VSEGDSPGRFFLTFKSTTFNLGTGPLVVEAHRVTPTKPKMVADQVVYLANRTTRTRARVGTARYDPDVDYERWGLTPFLSYELRKEDHFALVRKEADADFCLVDIRTSTKKALPGRPSHRVFIDKCGHREPDALDVKMGISVGWASQHSGGRKAQLIDITHLPAGTYWLVQRVNWGHRIKESHYDNNVSSLLLSVSRSLGVSRPLVTVLRDCPDSATCTPPQNERKHHGRERSGSGRNASVRSRLAAHAVAFSSQS
jgi:hypothetical protein